MRKRHRKGKFAIAELRVSTGELRNTNVRATSLETLTVPRQNPSVHTLFTSREDAEIAHDDFTKDKLKRRGEKPDKICALRPYLL